MKHENNINGGKYKMAHKIDTEKCIGCGNCAQECPVECITEKDGKFVINADECVDCGACEGACASEAIIAE